MGKNINLGVLVSGSGSNLQSIIDCAENGRIDATIKVIISNNPDAYALKRAEIHNIPSFVLKHQDYTCRENFDQAMIDILKIYSVELVVMAGFMRILSTLFLNAFPMKVMNIHPALLPSFPGTHVQKKAIEYGVKFSGCTVHFVDNGVDTGPIIIQGIVPAYDDDTEDSLSMRILKEEHKIYPQAIQFFAEDRIVVKGRNVYIKDSEHIPASAIHNPPLTIF